MTIVSNVDYTITIEKLLPEDDYATITSYNDDITRADDSDMGKYLSWSGFDLVNSIIEPAQAKSNLTLITSNFYNAGYNTFAGIDDGATVSIKDRVHNFLKTLTGRKISVSVTYSVYSESNQSFTEQSKEKTVFVGYIARRPENVTPNGGAKFTLECLPLIAQLNCLSPNASWQDTTETYDNPATTVVGTLLNRKNFEKLIYNNTILDKSKLEYINPEGYDPLPEELWTFLLPNRNRLPTINELLVPYSRILYQKANGDLFIAPLFYDDKTDPVFDIDAKDNSQTKNWLAVNGVNSSIDLPNRIDVTLGVTIPGSSYDLPDYDSLKQIACSAPYIIDGKISSIPQNNLKYTEIYKTSTRLYNSGKWIMPQMRPLSIDNAVTDPNSTIAATLMAPYKTWQFMNSVTNSSTLNNSNSIAQLYAQIYLAEINTNAYTSVVAYDYMAVIDADDPLAKIVNIANLDALDYADNLVTETVLSVSADAGSLFVIKTAPLLSILGCWYEKGESDA